MFPLHLESCLPQNHCFGTWYPYVPIVSPQKASTRTKQNVVGFGASGATEASCSTREDARVFGVGEGLATCFFIR